MDLLILIAVIVLIASILVAVILVFLVDRNAQRRQFFDNLPPQRNQLAANQERFLIGHYKRCEASWRSLIPTIWSIPSIAATINIAAYSLVLPANNNIDDFIKLDVLALLVVLNVVLTIGVLKHTDMQDSFGQRMIHMEEYFAVPRVQFRSQGLIGARFFYILLMFVVLLASAGLLIVHY